MADLKVLRGGDSGRETASSAEPGSAKWSDRIRREARSLAGRLETDYMKLAELLWTIYDTPVEGDPGRGSICTAWKDSSGTYYTSWDRYVESELGLNYKKAQRLRNVWKTLKIDLGLADKVLDQIVALGFSKVRELVRPGVLSDRNVDSWVSKAESMTYFRLTSAVTKYLADKVTAAATREAEREYNGALASPPADPGVGDADAHQREDCARIDDLQATSRQFVCTLYGDQIETVQLAMRRAAELSNSEKIGNNLSLICLDFLSTNDFKFSDDNQRLRFLAKFEKLTGYKMILVDPQKPPSDSVVYGISTLQKLASE